MNERFTLAEQAKILAAYDALPRERSGRVRYGLLDIFCRHYRIKASRIGQLVCRRRKRNFASSAGVSGG